MVKYNLFQLFHIFTGKAIDIGTAKIDNFLRDSEKLRIILLYDDLRYFPPRFHVNYRGTVKTTINNSFQQLDKFDNTFYDGIASTNAHAFFALNLKHLK